MKPRGVLIQLGLITLLSGVFSAIGAHPLESWVRRAVPGPNAPLNGVAFGNGVFVAVGNNSFVARSTNGATWTTSTAGAYGNLERVRFLNGQFVAVGSSDKIIFSTDGASWNSSTVAEAGFFDVAWGNGLYLISGNSTYVSSNGVQWSRRQVLKSYPLNFPPGATGYYETFFDTVVFGNGVFLGLPNEVGYYPVVSEGLPRRSFSSSNGVDWVAGGRTLQPSGGESELIFANGVWLATAHDPPGTADLNGALPSTNNGASWCCPFQGANGAGRWGGALAYGQGEFLWVQNHNIVDAPKALTAFTSTDGFSWTSRFSDTQTVAVLTRSADFGHGTFVVVGMDESGASYVLQSGNISGAPIIFQEPQDRGAVAMNPATLSVQVVGAATLQYQWYKDGTPITDATNSTFTIASVSTSDAGGYHVVISNSLGSVTSRVAQLTVAFLDINCYAGLTVLGVPGRTYHIEATPSSGSPNWQTVTNVVLPQSPYVWIDYASPSLPSRLYRASELP